MIVTPAGENVRTDRYWPYDSSVNPVPATDPYHRLHAAGEENKKMAADFTQTQNVKTAERELTAPIVDVTTFGTVLADLISNAPGADSAEIASQQYAAKFVINNSELTKLGEITVKVPSSDAYTAAITAIITNGVLDAIAGACEEGASIERNQSDDVFSARVKLVQTEEQGNETFYVTLAREKTRVTSYEAEAILTAVETWADTQEALD